MTRRNLLARMLVDAGRQGVTTGDILRAGVGSRYGARLAELRGAGWEITSTRLRDGEWRYTLRHAPSQPSVPAAACPPTPPGGAGAEDPPVLFEVGVAAAPHWKDAA